MQTLLHIGMAKTGSTALQQSLLLSHAALAARGVLYPQNPPGVSFVNHKLILAGMFEYDRLPGHLIRRGSSEELARKSARFLKDTRRAVDEMAPRCLILSTESFFRALPRPAHAKLTKLLEGMLGETRVVAYLRRPSEHYVSRLQQKLKDSYLVPAPDARKYRKVIESYAEAFGVNALSLNLYHRPSLVEGDIVADFAAKHLASYGIVRAELAKPERTNETISAESVDISRRFRLAFHRDNDNRFTPDSAQLIAALRAADAATGALRPQLRPGLADRIDYTCYDALWLRDQHGIEFPDFDYRQVERPSPNRTKVETSALENILVIDRARERAILAELRADPWASEPKRRAWIDALQAELT